MSCTKVFNTKVGIGSAGQLAISSFENKSVGKYKVQKYIVNQNHENKSSYKDLFKR